MKTLRFVTIALLFLGSCADTATNNIDDGANAVGVVNTDVDKFDDYWEQGEAEITTYDLKQARYGEIYEGTANTIFVTEPFSKSKQVKLDNPGNNPSDNIRVLKFNFTRKFFTGVYPYSTMLSVFTPVDQKKYPKALKATFSAQEWCGQAFSQLNHTDGGYEVEGFSYFESEGDVRSKVTDAVLEDDLWSALRIDPQSLPTGKFKAIAGLTFSRLSHYPVEAVEANAELTKGKKTSIYSLNYPSYKRTLSIEFNTAFPHEIVTWSEKGISGWGPNKKELTTTATVRSRKMLDYWNKHDKKDADLRAELGL